MQYIKTHIDGVVIIDPVVHGDSRGYFLESFSMRDFEANVRPIKFVQDNLSHSVGGVVRGLHFQRPPHAQSKLVSCVQGHVLDVALDLRADSPTFGSHVAVELSESNHRMIFLPRGIAHGFAVLSPSATFSYKCDDYYHPECEGGVNPFDPALAIDWMTDTEHAILSPKDLAHPNLAEALNSIHFSGNLYEPTR